MCSDCRKSILTQPSSGIVLSCWVDYENLIAKKPCSETAPWRVQPPSKPTLSGIECGQHLSDGIPTRSCGTAWRQSVSGPGARRIAAEKLGGDRCYGHNTEYERSPGREFCGWADAKKSFRKQRIKSGNMRKIYIHNIHKNPKNLGKYVRANYMYPLQPSASQQQSIRIPYMPPHRVEGGPSRSSHRGFSTRC